MVAVYPHPDGIRQARYADVIGKTRDAVLEKARMIVPLDRCLGWMTLGGEIVWEEGRGWKRNLKEADDGE